LYVQNRNANAQGSYFLLDQGMADSIPKSSTDISGKDIQLIATLNIAPYTTSAADIKIIYSDFPRYTMKDISTLDKRLTTVEKTVKRNSLDIQALNNKVFDRNGPSGNILYPTGILVDDFSGYGASFISSPYFTASVDPVRKECRPAFSARLYNLFFSTMPTDISTVNDFITMTYTEEAFIEQTTPSTKLLEVNPSGIAGAGRAKIYPQTINSSAGTITFPPMVWQGEGGE
jgi:hypothetical protein